MSMKPLATFNEERFPAMYVTTKMETQKDRKRGESKRE